MTVKKLHYQQAGMASILITMIMMLVISLIVVGFGQVTRRNRRIQVDNQLSVQAYYAAETGINEAYRVFFAGGATLNPADSNDCGQFTSDNAAKLPGYDAATKTVKISTSPDVAFTCLMLDAEPEELIKAPLTQGKTSVMALNNANGNNFSTITFRWTSISTSPIACSAATPTTFPAANAWGCDYGILRLDLVPTNNITNTTLETSSTAKTFFMVPRAGGGTTAYSTASAVNVINASYSAAAKQYSVTFAMPTVPAGSGSSYAARMTMLYADAGAVTVTGTDTTGAVAFKNGQLLIDSTGKDIDTVRRILVRVPYSQSGNLPPNALQSKDTICKRFTISAGGYATSDTADPLCSN